MLHPLRTYLILYAPTWFHSVCALRQRRHRYEYSVPDRVAVAYIVFLETNCASDGGFPVTNHFSLREIAHATFAEIEGQIAGQK